MKSRIKILIKLNLVIGRLVGGGAAGMILVALLSANEIRAQNSSCALKNDERIWIETTLRLWQTISRESLRLKPAPLPWIVLFDETCVWHVDPNLSVLQLKPTSESAAKSRLTFARKPMEVYGSVHQGKITLPDKQQIPARLVSFVGTYASGRKPFLVFAMPSIWRQAERLKTEPNLDTLIRSVFVHEMTHTRHRGFFSRLDEIEKQHVFSEQFSDDIIQDHFSRIETFRQSYEAERDLLYSAVSETKKERKIDLAKRVMTMIKNRRCQFFTGKDSHYAEIESIFLTMEGAANWAAYRAARAVGLNEADALKLIRRDGKKWSQDEGLALFLLIDALLPNWQKKAFDDSTVSVTLFDSLLSFDSGNAELRKCLR